MKADEMQRRTIRTCELEENEKRSIQLHTDFGVLTRTAPHPSVASGQRCRPGEGRQARKGTRDSKAHDCSDGQKFHRPGQCGRRSTVAWQPYDADSHFQTAAEINSREPLQSGCPPSGARTPAQAVEQYQREVLPRISGLLAATYANLGAAARKLGDDEKAQGKPAL